MRRTLFSTLIVIAFLLIKVPSVSAHQINFFGDGGYWGGDAHPILSCQGGQKTLNPQSGALQDNPNPCNTCELIHTGEHVMYFVLTLLVFVAIPVLIMWGGALILLSQGSSEKVEAGKKVITGAVMGIVLGLGAYFIVNTFLFFLAPVVGGTQSWDKFDCSKVPVFLRSPDELPKN